MWALSNQGRKFIPLASSKIGHARRIDAGEPDLGVNNGDIVEINFPSNADGRGFSLARRFRRLYPQDTTLIATGHILPDQARMLFQCGFDALWLEDALVARHGEEAWREAVSQSVTSLYVSNSVDRLTSSVGWDQRHQQQVEVHSLTSTETYDELQKLSSAKVIDVRTKAELNFVGCVRVDNCLYIEWKMFPNGQLNTDFLTQVEEAGVTKNCPIFVLCRSGVRSLEAAYTLKSAGYKYLTNISDGFEGDLNAQGHRGLINGWKASGLPWQQR